MSRKGEWNGTQLVPAAWIEESTHPDTADGGVAYYKYQWWISGDQKSFMAIGILGQYIYVHPEKDLVIVRLGKKEGKPEWWRILPSMALSF
jgi:CubicO group peptidase (beta-lactamase class C family)